MLTYLTTNLFDSPAQTLVNPVNTAGVMGKGIALAFKQRFTEIAASFGQKITDSELYFRTGGSFTETKTK